LNTAVWCKIVSCTVFCSGCGYPALDTLVAPPIDAPVVTTIDGATDAMIDGGSNGTLGCFDRWLDGTIKFQNAQPLPKQAKAGDDERDPWVSSDGLRLYYSSDSGGGSKSDVYLATRASATARLATALS